MIKIKRPKIPLRKTFHAVITSLKIKEKEKDIIKETLLKISKNIRESGVSTKIFNSEDERR
jgi:hypothetical protein